MHTPPYIRARAQQVVQDYQKIHDGPVPLKWALENLISAALCGDETAAQPVAAQTSTTCGGIEHEQARH